MLDALPLPAVTALAGLLLMSAGGLAMRRSGAQTGMGRRLAGAREYRVGDLEDLAELPRRPVRVAGRIRCPDPIITADDDRLAALHRDVEVRLPGGEWRRIERLRETRGFELWDHAGSLTLDPSQSAEPLVVIPHVWRGHTGELTDESHRSAVARLVAEAGEPIGARSITRMLSVVERLLVLAQVSRDAAGRLRLDPPPGGFVISALELPDAMRLLGGPRRGVLVAGAALAGLGAGLLLAGVLAALFGLLSA